MRSRGPGATLAITRAWFGATEALRLDLQLRTPIRPHFSFVFLSLQLTTNDGRLVVSAEMNGRGQNGRRWEAKENRSAIHGQLVSIPSSV